MKISYLSESIIPSRNANSIHVMKMCHAFAKNGNDVTLFAPDYPNNEVQVNNTYEFYGVEASFNIKKLIWLNNFKGKARFYGLLAAFYSKKLKPKIAYGRCLQSCFFSSQIGLPVIYESHKLLDNPSRITAWMFKRMICSKNFQHLVVISDALKYAYQKKYHIPLSQIIVAHDAADQPQETQPIKFNSSQFQVGYIGHLYPGKGMEIIANLAKVSPWADFQIIGGKESDINYWQTQLRGLKNIFFHGFIPPSETEKYRQGCDVLIAPYQRNVSTCGGGNIGQWMSPLKLFEYMASGKAIMTSNLPVLKEVLTHKVTAWLCEPDDINSWVVGLTNLREQPLLRLSLAQAAKKEFQDKYTWKARVAKVIRGII